MIDPRAVRAFLSRKLANSEKVKVYSKKELEQAVNELEPVPRFELPPYRHQLATFWLMAKYPGYLGLLDMGAGKSAIALSSFRWRKDRGDAKRMLITVPFAANIGAWEDEARIHAPDLTFAGVYPDVKKEQRLQVLLGDADVVAVTHAGLARILTQGKGKGAIHLPTLKKVGGAFQFLVHDESSLLGGVQSLYFQIARRLRKFCPYTYGLTGTPFNSDPQGAWAQFAVCDGGETLGETLGLFREAFFECTRNRWGGYEYKFDRAKELLLHLRFRHRAIRYAEEEMNELPEKVGGIDKPMLVPVRLTTAAFRYQEQLLAEFKKARGDHKMMKSAYVRMRCLASGYLPLVSAEDPKNKTYIDFTENPKLDALDGLLDQLEGKSVIIVHTYRRTGKLITKHLAKKKHKYAWVYGGTTDKRAELARFTSGKAKILVCSRSAAFGLNLQQACARMIFFETPDDVAGRKQMEKRIHRPGQNERCYYWDIVLTGSIDQRIMESLREGKELFDVLMDGGKL